MPRVLTPGRRAAAGPLSGCIAIWITSCAWGPGPRFGPGLDLAAGRATALPSPPDSLRARLELTAFRGAGGRAREGAHGVFTARPGRAYRLDLYGLPGVLAASLVWTAADSAWTVVDYQDNAYARGRGSAVRLPTLGAEAIPVRLPFAFLWGEYWPPGLGWAPAPGAAGAGFRAGPWRLGLDPVTGLVRSLEDTALGLRMDFDRYARGPGRPLARRVRVYARGRETLELEPAAVDDHPRWRRDPFRLQVPADARPMPEWGDGP